MEIKKTEQFVVCENGCLSSQFKNVFTDKQKQHLRSKFYRRKRNIDTFFGMERTANYLMLIGEINIYQYLGVFSEKRANELRDQCLESL